MSFILDALKKAEGSRPVATMPSMPKLVLAAEPGRLEPNRRLPVWGIVAAGCVGVVLVALFLWRQNTQQPAPVPQASATQREPVAPPTVARARQAPEALPVVRERSQVRPLDGEARAALPPPSPATRPQPDRSASTRVTAAATPPGKVVYLDATGQPAAAPDIATGPARGTVQYEDSTPASPAPTPAPAPVARPVAGGVTAGVPLYDNVRLGGSIDLPPLHMDIHVYSQAVENRFVFVNMRKYRQGQKLPDGVTVEEITPDGAILQFRGQRFLLPPN